MDFWAFGTLVLAAFGLGWLVLCALQTPREDTTTFVALAMATGLGLTGVLLGTLALLGWLHAARFLLPVGAVLTLTCGLCHQVGCWFGCTMRTEISVPLARGIVESSAGSRERGVAVVRMNRSVFRAFTAAGYPNARELPLQLLSCQWLTARQVCFSDAVSTQS
jgi:hypothetical protein